MATRQNIRILYACESGSRAWGFPSPDSDFDVRFVYAHEPNYYLSIDDKKDTIEQAISDELDVNGWDVRKALQLFRKSNAALFEWMQSPVVYAEDASFASELRRLMSIYFSARTVMYHHIGIVRKIQSETTGEPTIKLKKYFYMLRSLLSAVWIRENASVPPMALAPLRRVIRSSHLQTQLDAWLALKAVSDEKTRVERNTLVDEYIQTELAACETYASTAPVSEATTDELNTLYRKTLRA